MIADHITPTMLFSVVGFLVASLAAVLWFFFQRLYTQNDRQSKRLDDLIEKVGALKSDNHNTEVRMNARIDKLDADLGTTARDVSILFTKFESLHGDIKLLKERMRVSE